jgi:hypothetical protein
LVRSSTAIHTSLEENIFSLFSTLKGSSRLKYPLVTLTSLTSKGGVKRGVVEVLFAKKLNLKSTAGALTGLPSL